MNCPKCNSTYLVKNGFVRERQRRLCKKCGYNFTQTAPRGKPQIVKRLAVHMYLEGLGFRSIGRILNVSNVAVLKWIQAMADFLEPMRKKLLGQHTEKAVITCMEFDEMWHYVGKKNANSGSGWLLIELQEESLRGKLVVVAQEQGRSFGSK